MDTAVLTTDEQAVAHRPVGVGASIATASTLASAVMGGLTTVVVARLLGPAGTGVYSIVVATLAGLMTVAALGLDTSALYHVAGRRWGHANAIRQLQLAALALGTCGIGLGVAFGVALRGSAFHGVGLGTLALGLAALPFALAWSFGSAVAFARDEYERASLPWVIQAVSGLILAAALTPPFDVSGAVAGIAASHALAATFVAASGLRRTRAEAPQWLSQSFSDLRVAVGFGYKANLTKVMAIVNQRADLLILNAYATQAVVGRYGVALSLTAVQVILPSSLSRAVVPRVASLGGEHSPGGRAELILKSVKHGILISVLTGALMALGLLAVPAVFGSGFEQSVELGWILIPGTTAYGMAYALSAVIVGSGHPRYILRASAVVTPVTLALYLLLISRFHATGAAVASTLSYAGTLGLYWFYFRRVSDVSSIRALMPGWAELDDYRSLVRRMPGHARTP